MKHTQTRAQRTRQVQSLAILAMFTGILFLLTFTPLGQWLGLTALPPVYFAFLIGTVFFYLLWVTLAKWWYIRRHHELL